MQDQGASVFGDSLRIPMAMLAVRSIRTFSQPSLGRGPCRSRPYLQPDALEVSRTGQEGSLAFDWSWRLPIRPKNLRRNGAKGFLGWSRRPRHICRLMLNFVPGFPMQPVLGLRGTSWTKKVAKAGFRDNGQRRTSFCCFRRTKSSSFTIVIARGMACANERVS